MQNAVVFLAVSFPKKAFVFPNNRISKARICRQCWFKKISRNRKTKQQKKLRGNVFPLSPRPHAKIELIWTRKKIRPKKPLTRLLHAALQFRHLPFTNIQSNFVAVACLLYGLLNNLGKLKLFRSIDYESRFYIKFNFQTSLILIFLCLKIMLIKVQQRKIKIKLV